MSWSDMIYWTIISIGCLAIGYNMYNLFTLIKSIPTTTPSQVVQPVVQPIPPPQVLVPVPVIISKEDVELLNKKKAGRPKKS